MKKKYTNPEINIYHIGINQIIATSGTSPDGLNGYQSGEGLSKRWHGRQIVEDITEDND